ncbi:MAG TPA: SO2930 family diheme c-type cytochrome [Dyella sp.]|uniref:SO2930 family diheme c-type cytochrome n=1 Tax=Dyella sp. TaxID=1869338 RepID=UPI002BA340B1|nr:SO2930 family diheme c-type cytochrome [Dyella sp.]HTV86326.1 SO2930 family diheme c-type cytochrome [Dyella sp.]
MPKKMWMCGWLLALACLCGCHRAMDPVAFHDQGYPQKLSDWHVLQARGGVLQLNEGVVPYDLNTPLFTDYAHKLRTIWMPKGVAATYNPTGTFDFPVGTIISKTFFYPLPKGEARNPGDVARTYDTRGDIAGPGQGLQLANVHLVETRLLVRRKDGWVAIPYVWNASQTDAMLARTGDIQPLTLVSDNGERENFNYVVPDQSQCASCHARDWTTRALQPIGPKARHLNRDYRYADGEENELAHLVRVGYLTGAPAPAQAPRNANWMDANAPLDARARAYLDINCGHCHNPKGAANTTGLTLDIATPEDHHLGICKPPTAAGQGTGDHDFDIVPGHPDDSILPYRLSSATPGTMMPELGRSTVHQEGVALIKAWIASLSGDCKVLH